MAPGSGLPRLPRAMVVSAAAASSVVFALQQHCSAMLSRGIRQAAFPSLFPSASGGCVRRGCCGLSGPGLLNVCAEAGPILRENIIEVIELVLVCKRMGFAQHIKL